MPRILPSTLPFHRLAKEGNVQAMQEMLESQSVDINGADDNLETPLFLASWAGHSAAVELLLQNGANVETEASPNFGFTTLIAAVQYGHTDVARLLLEHGADANRENTRTGATPLMIACYFNYIDIVRLLLDHGADVEKPGIWTGERAGETPLITAVVYGSLDTVKLLLERGAIVDRPNDRPLGTNSSTPLFWAVKTEELERVKLLLEHGANPNYGEDERRLTPFLLACKRGFFQIIKLMLEHGANVNMDARLSLITPLHLASAQHRTDVVRLLLAHGANPNVKQQFTWGEMVSAVDRAVDPNWRPRPHVERTDAKALEIAQLLLMYGSKPEVRPRNNPEEFPMTMEWLESVAGFSQFRILATLGAAGILKNILRSEDSSFEDLDLFPPDAALVPAAAPQLFREVRMPWAETRHSLFAPDDRAAVRTVYEIARRYSTTADHAQNFRWVANVPLEVWRMILQKLPRAGTGFYDWPNRHQPQLQAAGQGL